jgi:hypothetical protein
MEFMISDSLNTITVKEIIIRIVELYTSEEPEAEKRPAKPAQSQRQRHAKKGGNREKTRRDRRPKGHNLASHGALQQEGRKADRSLPTILLPVQ